MIHQANVDISGTANGKLMAIANNAGPLNQADKTYSFADFQGAAKKASKVFKDVNKFAEDQRKAIDTLLKNNPTTAANKKSKLTDLQSALKGSGFLRSGLAAAPYIGAAVSLLDFFIGGGKKTPPTGPQEVKLTPTSIDMTIKLNGTITTDFNYGGALFWNPGSNIASQGDEDYPYYNEIMGIFNLTETPRVNKVTVREQVFGDTKDQMYWQTSMDYRVQNPIKYVVNPAARLTLQDARVALVVQGDSSSVSGPAGDAWEIEGKDEQSGLWQYRSAYIDVNCLNKKIFKIRGNTQPGNTNWLPRDKVYLKFLLNFKRLLDTAGAQNVLLVVKYPVYTPGVSSVGTTTTVCNSSLFLPATNTEINTLCTSITYKTNRVTGTRKKEVPLTSRIGLEKALQRTMLAPNPTSSYSSLLLDVKQPIRLNIYLADGLGKRIQTISSNKTYATGYHNERINAERLPSGAYNVVMENGTSRIVKKLIVQR